MNNQIATTPKGYKQSEVGVIPDDWNIRSLGDVCIKVQDGNYGGSYPKSREFLNYGIPFLTSKAIGKDGVLKRELIDFISAEKHSELHKAHLQLNDVLFTNRGASVGAIGFVEEDICHGNIGPQLTLLRANEDVILSSFLFQIMKSEIVKKQISSQDSGSAMNFFGIRETKKFLLPCPSLKSEQVTIATALFDINALVVRLENLIAKKRAIKQGVMQELLTGKRRLPGFSGEWVKKRLGNVCELNKGTQINKSRLTETGKYPVWNGGINPSGYMENWNTENSITISEGGNSCGFVNYCDSKFWCGGHCYAAFLIEKEMDKEFFFQKLKYNQEKIMGLRVGSGLPNIQKKNLLSMELILPKEQLEQTAIALALSEMDTEINSIEHKLIKYKQIEIGMMQQLLTGKIRIYAKQK